jgi:glycosyltransferase involved in cell wall biosynthesis
MPKVSIVIPNYNHARFLRRRLESVLRQTFQDFEAILLDDCSTDDSRSILSEYADDPRVKIEFNDANSGSPFKQWNKGVGLAGGEYVWIAESDDYADERFLEKLVPRLDSEPSVAFAYCRSWRVSVDDRPDGLLEEQHRWTADYCADGYAECSNYMVRGSAISNASAVLFRKAVYKRVGGADESLCLCGDWKLWAAMALTGKVAYVAEPLNYFRFHGTSVRSLSRKSGIEIAETVRVRLWILEQVIRLAPPNTSGPQPNRTLANCYMELAFQSYPDFPDVTRLALGRVRELGGADEFPRFGTWKGQLLKRIIGWKATKWANAIYHRSIVSRN